MPASVLTEISVKGKPTQVPSICIDGRTAIVTGGWLKTVVLKDENLIEGEIISNPVAFVDQIKKSNLNADILTFPQKLSDTLPKYDLYFEWDNWAVVSITTYQDWLDMISGTGRKIIKKSQKLGVVVKEVEFDDTFVQGIKSIYDETPVRQGKPFWHYGKSFEAVKKMNSTFPDRSTYIGAYFNDELIGYIWLVYVDKAAYITQIVSKVKDFDKKPTNALLAKAVEVCEQKGMSYFVYGNYTYNDLDSSLTEFKRRNGFQKVDVPRYYVGLTWKGQLAVKLGLHHGVMGVLPHAVKTTLLRYRAAIFERLAGPA